MTNSRPIVLPIHDQVAVHAIVQDVQFVSRLMGSVQALSPSLSAFSMFCMVPYMSLFVYESRPKLAILDASLAGAFTPQAEAVLARSRHSLKLFDDTKRGVEGQLAYFRNDILPVHRDRFLGRRPFVRPWANDLGFYLYKDVPTSSTHIATFAAGLDPQDLYGSGSSGRIRAIFEEYGRYFGMLGATVDPAAESFASHLEPADVRGDDVQSDRYYGRIFNGPATKEINVLLVAFRLLLNFVHGPLSLDRSKDSWLTAFKIRFLTLYHVQRSLQVLRQERRADLTKRSEAAIGKIIDNPDAQLLLSDRARPLRNTLMHYRPDATIAESRLDLGAPLYGLAPGCFPAEDTSSLAALIEAQAGRAAQTMNEWADLSS